MPAKQNWDLASGTHPLTSHIWNWKRRLSFSISSAISPPLNSVRIIPCCLACSFFSFSILVLQEHRGLSDDEAQDEWMKKENDSLINMISISAQSKLTPNRLQHYHKNGGGKRKRKKVGNLFACHILKIGWKELA